MTDPGFHKQQTLPGFVPPPHPSNFKIPEKIGEYPVESLLDMGSTSILYLGTHPETKQPTTIKVLSPRYLSHQEMVQRFLNEAAIIALADHPNIVKLFGYGRWEGGLFIAMEFIQGVSLRQYLLQTPLSLKRALEIVIDIAYALCHLHAHGIIHRDLKPENVLITHEGIVKVIDFGIAQLLTEQEEDSKKNSRLIGTPVYMSPEQRENPESVGYPSDIYSLGIIAYELVLGKLSLGQIHLSLMPKGIQRILSKSLQLDPKERYQDVVDFISDLMDYLHSNSIQKERQLYDQASELNESLRRAQIAFFPTSAPNWEGIDIGIASHRSFNLNSSLYCEMFLGKNSTYNLFFAGSRDEDSAGLIAIATLRGMIRNELVNFTESEEFISKIQQCLIRDSLKMEFVATFLQFNAATQEIRVINCGSAPILALNLESGDVEEISAENSAYLGSASLEMPIKSHKQQWLSDRIYFMHNFDLEFIKERSHTLPAIKEAILPTLPAMDTSSSHSVQQYADNLLRKICLSLLSGIKDRPLSLLAIKKTDSSI